MAFNPFRPAAPAMRAHVIRIIGPVSAHRFAVLATDAGEALAAVVADLGHSEIAEVTGDVLVPAAAASLGLEPGQPLRLA